MYFKEIEWQKEYGKLLSDMQKFQRVAENLDPALRKVNREMDRIEAMRKIQEEEEEARRLNDEEALRQLELRRQEQEELRLKEEEEARQRAFQ